MLTDEEIEYNKSILARLEKDEEFARILQAHGSHNAKQIEDDAKYAKSLYEQLNEPPSKRSRPNGTSNSEDTSGDGSIYFMSL